MKLVHSLLIAVVCLAPVRVAQPQTIADNNFNSWFMYFGDHPVSRHWGLHLEGQMRRSEGAAIWQQLLLRPGVNYQINKHFMLTGGYAFVNTYPYGDWPITRSFPEHRVFQQLLVSHPLGRLGFQHRFRLEQRWLKPSAGAMPGDNWEFRQRARYMLRTDIPLARSGRLKRFGIGLYDEVFANFGAHGGPRILDHNRAYGALTYKLTPKNRIEFGYLHQYIPQRNGMIFEHNHTLQFAWYSTSRISGSEQ